MRFNAVGLLGAEVQLAALRVLEHFAGGHYLLASLAALELTLVHNFWWHQRLTWRDRRVAGGGWWGQMVRFQAGNGMVSLVGNLVGMRVLVGGLGMPLVAANAVAIGGCSVVNFGVSHWWAFGGAAERQRQERPQAGRAALRGVLDASREGKTVSF